MGERGAQTGGGHLVLPPAWNLRAGAGRSAFGCLEGPHFQNAPCHRSLSSFPKISSIPRN